MNHGGHKQWGCAWRGWAKKLNFKDSITNVTSAKDIERLKSLPVSCYPSDFNVYAFLILFALNSTITGLFFFLNNVNKQIFLYWAYFCFNNMKNVSVALLTTYFVYNHNFNLPIFWLLNIFCLCIHYINCMVPIVFT